MSGNFKIQSRQGVINPRDFRSTPIALYVSDVTQSLEQVPTVFGTETDQRMTELPAQFFIHDQIDLLRRTEFASGSAIRSSR